MASYKKTWIRLLCACALLLAPLSPSPPSRALSAGSPPPAFTAGDNEDMRELLQKTLSVTELEREIGRIAAEQEELERQADRWSREAVRKQSEIAGQQEKAAAVVRSYYVGERDGLLAALLSADSFADLFAVLDYYEIIMGHDRAVLDRYKGQYAGLKQAVEAADRSSRELAELKLALEEQRARVTALNEDIRSGVHASGDPSGMATLLEEFSLYWENIGLYEVKKYFKALSSAMNGLPDYVQSRDGMLKRNGLTYQLSLREEDLNEFLLQQNKLFEGFAFSFNEGTVTATGTQGGLSLALTGRYTVQEEPVNGLMFHVDRIVFNGLELPQATNRELEEEFDLGFYPSKIMSFVKASDVQTEDGVLSVTLSLSF